MSSNNGRELDNRTVLVLGSSGVIGSVISSGLASEWDVINCDLPQCDIRSPELVEELVSQARHVIHVAHTSNQDCREDWLSATINPINIEMEMNVLHAAAKLGGRRVIMASSVHADDFLSIELHSDLLDVPGSFSPTSMYGCHKLLTEYVAQSFADRGLLEYVGLRLGGVSRNDSARTSGREPLVWLSHRDLLSCIRKILESPSVPTGKSVFYVVSDNTNRLHSTSNPFGWSPVDRTDAKE